MAKTKRRPKKKRPTKRVTRSAPSSGRGRGVTPRRKARHFVTFVVTLAENGHPRRRAEIKWPAGRDFTVMDLAAHRDCGRWLLLPEWLVRIHQGEDDEVAD